MAAVGWTTWPLDGLTALWWPLASSAIWIAYLVLRRKPTRQDWRLALTGLAANSALAEFLRLSAAAYGSRDFEGLADIFYFCGRRHQYCSCSSAGPTWNALGFGKAAVLAVWMLTSAIGLQRLAVQLVLGGLLPGEDVVTRESFVSIAWRLVPLALNNMERRAGPGSPLEASSVLWELPQFAIELLVILPCIQIFCSRAKVLVLQSVDAALPPGYDGVSAATVEAGGFVPNVLRGCWERRPEQARLAARLAANRRVICFVGLVCLAAAGNALLTPLALESAALAHPFSVAVLEAGRGLQPQDSGRRTQVQLAKAVRSLAASRWAGVEEALQQGAADAPREGALRTLLRAATGIVSGSRRNATAAAPPPAVLEALEPLMVRLESSACTWDSPAAAVSMLQRTVLRHHRQLSRMQDPSHRATVMMIEGGLAIMRLATEHFFVLVSLYAAMLLFRVPPKPAAALVTVNARLSTACVRIVLNIFPLMCWLCGAGVVFSSLVSVVFWGGPLWRLCFAVRARACSARIKDLRPATAAEVQRMGDCPICLQEMSVAQQQQQQQQQPDTAALTAGDSTAASPAAVGAPTLGQPATAAAAPAAPAATAADGHTLPCGHAYHSQCVQDWLNQCYAQGTPPRCPLCQAAVEMTVTWHFWRVLGLGQRQRQQELQEEEAQLPGSNNFLLRHHLLFIADMLADTPQFLAPHNITLLAEVQDLRQQRRELVVQLHGLRQERALVVRELHHRLELEEAAMQAQRQQLLHEIEELVQAREQQARLLQLEQQQQQGLPSSHAAEEPNSAQQQPQQRAQRAGGWRWRIRARARAGQEQQPHMQPGQQQEQEQQTAAGSSSVLAAAPVPGRQG